VNNANSEREKQVQELRQQYKVNVKQGDG